MRPEQPNRAPVPREDRRLGAILGLAVGDALGAPYEFRRPKDVPAGPLEMLGGGVFDWRPGETTDDTALANAVLEGYRSSVFDLRRVRDAMLRWQDTRPKAIGNQTARAFRYLRSHPEALSLPKAPEAQGNGAVMRAAPHGLKAGNAREAIENAWKEAALTHPSWEAQASSALVASLVAHLLDGVRPEEALNASYSLLESRNEPGKRVDGALRPLENFSHSPGGWTVYTSRLALLSLLTAEDFHTGLENVIRLVGDADTNGAVVGSLLGSRFGASSIPRGWLDDVLGKYELLELI